MFRSTSLRLAAIYTGVFAAAVALLGVVCVLAMHKALSVQFDSRIRTELAAVRADYLDEGLKGLFGELDERRSTPGELAFGVRTRDGRALAGPLAGLKLGPGWSQARVTLAGKPTDLRILAEDLPGGYRLLAGDDLGRIGALDASIAWGFGLAFVGVIAIGAIGGFALSRAVAKRLGAITTTAEAIIDGDLGRRIPFVEGDDDLSRLARTINHMLDRIQTLMDSVRQVSSDVAHDLRTPLNRLKRRLEASQQGLDDTAMRREIEGSLRDVDGLLATFAALLRIAEIDGGARRAGFQRVDLTALARQVFEDYLPAAEDAGRRLELHSAGPATVFGDEPLLTQMLVNLVENGLTHTPPGSTVTLSARAGGAGLELEVRDNGPGVPQAERGRVLDRFYRLERSRSTPGSGLGLALVAAVARLHRADVDIADAEPGLSVTIRFGV